MNDRLRHSSRVTIRQAVGLALLLLLIPAAANGQGWGTAAITPLSDLDYNDGGSTVISQNQGDVVKQGTAPYIAKFEITVDPHPAKDLLLNVTVTKPATTFPFQMDVATNVNADDPNSACTVPATFDICVPSGHTAPPFVGYVYAYGTVTVGNIPAQQYTHNITADVTYTDIDCDAQVSPC